MVPSNLLPQLPPPIPNVFPLVDHAEGGDENQPHNSAHNSTSTANQDVVAAQLAAMNNSLNPQPVQHASALSESQGQSHIAPAQQPLPNDVTRRLDSLEKLVAEQREMASAFATKFSSRRLIRKTTSELMRVKRRDGESLKNYMSRFNDVVLEVSSFDQVVGIAVMISGLKHDRFQDSLFKHPATTFSEVNDRSLKFITAEEYALAQNSTPPKNQNPNWRDENPSRKRMRMAQNRGPMSTSTPRFRRPNSAPPQQSTGKPPVTWTPFNLPRSQIFMQIKNKMDLRRPGPMITTIASRDHNRYCDFHQDHGHTTEQCNSLRSELESLAQKGMLNEYIQRAEQPRFVREQRPQPQGVRNPPNRQGVGYQQASPPLPPPARIIHMIIGGLEVVQRVLVDTGSAPDIMYFHCFESLGLDPALLQRYDGPIYGFNNQPVQVEGVLTLHVAFGSSCTYVTPLVWFLVVKMASSFNVVIGRPTLTEIRVVVCQSHLCMKFPTPMGITTLQSNQEVARHCYITSVTQPKKGKDHTPEAIPQRIPDHQQVMGVEIVDNRPEDETRAAPVEDVEEVANPVLVKKANGKWRMCIDYTNLNQACPKDCYPMPSIDKLVEAASVNERLSLLDAYSRYHQKMVTIVFRAQIGRNLEVYVDDIVVKSLKAEDHLADLDETFNNLKKNRMQLNPTKCIFGVESGKFLECTPGHSTPNPESNDWTLYVDGASSSKGSGAGALLIGPDGYRSEHALKFNFDATNNMTEYEALLLGLQLALELKISAIQVYTLVAELRCKFQKFYLSKIPRTENEQANSLSKFASDRFLSSRSVFVEVLDEPSFMKSREAMKLRKKASRYTFINGVLYKRSFSFPLLRCLNPYEVEYALKEVHEGVCGSHIGARTLAHKVLWQGYYWSNMYKEATHFVQRCPKCQFFAHLTHQPSEELMNLVAPWPFAQWGLDLLGLFMKGVNGVTYLIVGVDYFTKWVEARALSSLTSKKVEDFVFSSIIYRYGIPIHLGLPSESNGMVESVNKCILEGIKPRLEKHKARWADELNNVLWAYRTTSRTATGETPYHLAFGTEAIIPIEIRVPSFKVTHFDEGRNGQLLRENLDLLDEVRKEARLQTLVYKQKITNFYNKRVRPQLFKVRDLVLRKAGLTGFEIRFGKLTSNWEGLYVVVEVPHPGAYILRDTEGKRVPRVWNVNNLKKFYP
ncbi:hypothetical protein SLEP1_g43074 [Rubroshorea leprosula]|uniref:Integrase catalytic domain-containing protein n=1 Tax=Rubroshorea leprosula TaxID=152421 RepID=A0AAV5LCA1_9ROSI|nr:hypothetical protein SLEP1_g43074 [Rubroshorea leprosula]